LGKSAKVEEDYYGKPTPKLQSNFGDHKMENIKKIKKFIDKSQNITLCPSPDFRKDTFPATLALFYSLKKLGKNVNLITQEYPSRFKFLTKKGGVHLPEADFLISIKEAGAKISQLSYEKTENGLALYLKTNGGELKKENISLQPLGLGDLAITLGVESLRKIEKFLKEKPKFLINIDNQLENENYGEVNLVEVTSPSLSEIVLDVLRAIEENLFDKEVSNCLLCGIIEGTSNFQDPKLNPQTLQKASFLMEKGANFGEIVSQLYGIKNEGSLRLFGKVLSKINVVKEKNLGWVLLKKEDFSQTNSSPLNLRFTLEKLSASLFSFQNFLCLWESVNSPTLTRGVFYSPNKRMIEKILENFEGAQKGNGVLFVVEEPDPQKVKDKILELL
jgi:nanoRNase/pAp phosphatase (c-di-AMP/oligoRNAs hydrolase)